MTGCDATSVESRASQLVKGDGVVISQIYGAGGNTGSVLTFDYVELFNRGASTVALGGASVQYAAAPNSGNNWSVQPLPSVNLDPGQYFLVQLAAQSMNVGVALPVTADSTSTTMNMSASAGKVALVSNTTPLDPCGTNANHCSTKTNVVDLVGFGNAVDFEGSGAAPTLAVNTVALRRGDGCQDTNDNAADFTTGTWTPGPAGVTLHNRASGTFPCADVDGGTVVGGSDGGGTSTTDLAAQPADLSVTPVVDMRPPADLRPPTDLTAPPVVDMTATGPVDLASGSGGSPVVISQFYGAGGNSGAAYKNDYIEIFNRGSTDADIGNWSVQYGASGNNFSLKATIPSGTTLPPGRYLLIQMAGGSTGSALPSPDLTPTGTSSFNMSASDGKIALVSNNTLLNCGASRCTSTSIVDLVGFGTSTDYEGTAVSPPSTAARSLRRLAGGCVDTDDNRADFESQPAMPRNLSSPANNCSGVSFDLGTTTMRDGSATVTDMATTTPVDFATTVPPDFATPTPPDMTTTGGGRRDRGCSCDVTSARSTGDGIAGPALLALVAAAALLRRRARLALNRRRST